MLGCVYWIYLNIYIPFVVLPPNMGRCELAPWLGQTFPCIPIGLSYCTPPQEQGVGRAAMCNTTATICYRPTSSRFKCGYLKT